MSRQDTTARLLDQASMDALPMVAWETDADGIVTLAPVGGGVGGGRTPWRGWRGRSVAAATAGMPDFEEMTRQARQGRRSNREVTCGPATYQVTVGPRFDEGGEVVGTTGCAIDVSELRSLKTDLAVRQEQLRLLVDTALDAVITCDINSVILEWNNEAAGLFGWTREEAVGRKLFETIIPEDLRAAHLAGMRRFLEVEEGPVLGRRIEIEAVDRSGRRFPIELGINPIPTSHGPVFSAFLRDITERVDQEQRLIGSEYRLRGALDAMEAGTWDYRLGPDGSLIEATVDDRVRELLEDDADVLPPGRDSILEVDRASVADAWNAHLEGLTPRFSVEYRIHGDSEDVRWRRELGMCVFDATDTEQEFAGQVRQPFRVIGVVTDVTPSKAMESSLQDARKLEVAGQIASQFAHDLNNVLTAISGHISLLELDKLSERARGSVEVIKDAVARGGALTRNMLQMGRPVRGRRSEVDVPRLLEHTLRLSRAILGQDIHLDTRIADYVPCVYLDENQLQQAILNLLINARDAMAGKGTITVSAEEMDSTEGSMVLIEVVDDGPGMSPEVLSKVTRPFFTTKGSKGTGLGLATIDRLVKSEEGRLEIKSVLGSGTRVGIVLPAGRVVSSTGGVSESDPIRRVMVVEDHPLLRPMLTEALANAGCATQPCPDGESALREVDDFEPDLVVLDVNLPGQSGDLLALSIRRKIGRDVPVLFVTGNQDFELPDLPAVDLIQKPFELLDFIRRVNDFSIE